MNNPMIHVTDSYKFAAMKLYHSIGKAEFELYMDESIESFFKSIGVTEEEYR